MCSTSTATSRFPLTDSTLRTYAETTQRSAHTVFSLHRRRATMREFGKSGKKLASPRFLAWSPKGDKISYSLYLFDQGVGAVDILNTNTSKSDRFAALKGIFPSEIHWLYDDQTLLMNYGQVGASKGQIGLLRHGGNIQPITRDTNTYRTLTVSADGRSIASVQARSYASISVLSRLKRGFGKDRLVLARSGECFNDRLLRGRRKHQRLWGHWGQFL